MDDDVLSHINYFWKLLFEATLELCSVCSWYHCCSCGSLFAVKVNVDLTSCIGVFFLISLYVMFICIWYQ